MRNRTKLKWSATLQSGFYKSTLKISCFYTTLIIIVGICVACAIINIIYPIDCNKKRAGTMHDTHVAYTIRRRVQYHQHICGVYCIVQYPSVFRLQKVYNNILQFNSICNNFMYAILYYTYLLVEITTSFSKDYKLFYVTQQIDIRSLYVTYNTYFAITTMILFFPMVLFLVMVVQVKDTCSVLNYHYTYISIYLLFLHVNCCLDILQIYPFIIYYYILFFTFMYCYFKFNNFNIFKTVTHSIK